VYTFVGMVTGKGSSDAAGLPNPAGQQAGAQFGTGGGSAFGPQQPVGETGGTGRVAPGVFQEQR
jgi:hypothetical protein